MLQPPTGRLDRPFAPPRQVVHRADTRREDAARLGVEGPCASRATRAPRSRPDRAAHPTPIVGSSPRGGRVSAGPGGLPSGRRDPIGSGSLAATDDRAERVALVERVLAQMRAEGRRPYLIPRSSRWSSRADLMDSASSPGMQAGRPAFSNPSTAEGVEPRPTTWRHPVSRWRHPRFHQAHESHI